MRTLSATLLEAQRSASAEPYLRVRMFDRDVGAIRLRWERWYAGTEPDGPCATAAPPDGALLRARIEPASGTLSHQRVASPSASSDFSAWSNLGSVAPTPRLGLAAAGTRALLATVRADILSVEVRESTDSGASFGASSVVATAAAAVSAVACAVQTDGSAAVLYAVGGVVYAVTRSGLGAWSSPQAWTASLASVSALTAYFEADYNVLLSGATAAGDQGVWATMLGAGGAAPPGSWSALSEVASASAGTEVAYRATGAATADVPRLLFVESYSGAGGYDRVHVGAAVASATWLDFRWREPRPFGHTSPYGLAAAASGGHAWLCGAAGVWHAEVAATEVDLTEDVVEAELEQGLDRGRLRLMLRNDDGRYNAASAPRALSAGGELLVAPGYRTTAGLESSEGPRFWITTVRRVRRGGSSTVEILAVDGWGLLRAWTAPRQLTWGGGAKSAFQLLDELARRVGLTAVLGAASAEATALKPAFTVRAGESAAAALARLREMLPDEVVVRGLQPTLVEPVPTETPDYAYVAGDSEAGHALTALDVEQAAPAAGWARVFGSGIFAEAVDEARLRDGSGTAIVIDDNLTAQARADARASTVLRKAALALPRGALVARPNVGQEPGDVIEVTDPSLGLESARFRVGALRLVFARGGTRPRYEMTLSLREV